MTRRQYLPGPTRGPHARSSHPNSSIAPVTRRGHPGCSLRNFANASSEGRSSRATVSTEEVEADKEEETHRMEAAHGADAARAARVAAAASIQSGVAILHTILAAAARCFVSLEPDAPAACGRGRRVAIECSRVPIKKKVPVTTVKPDPNGLQDS